MYLTQIPAIDGDDYQQHQNVRKLFYNSQKVLFQRNDIGITVYSDYPCESIQGKEIDMSSIVVGGQYTFTIRLNPAKRDLKTHKRVAIDTNSLKDWISDKLLKAGVEAKFQYIKEGVRRSLKQDKPISLYSILCFGTFSIKDIELFKGALINGIGHAKGLGFGLLNIF